jgi:D-alanyl-lipoteichoic acid acyltransferase DltB (MBOAT superfamily)
VKRETKRDEKNKNGSQKRKKFKKNFALFLRFFFCALWAGDRNTYIIWDTCTRTDILYKGQNILRHRQLKDKNQKQITKDNGILASENKMSRMMTQIGFATNIVKRRGKCIRYFKGIKEVDDSRGWVGY